MSCCSDEPPKWDASRHALLSVTDKTGIVEFARGLADLGITLWSTGGTAAKIREAGVPVCDVADMVGKELFGDLVKTLSREVAAGCLCDPFDPAHVEQILEHAIKVFEVVCVNFYPLEDEIAKSGATDESIRRNTDVGGPTMAHEAAKGRKGGYRVVVTDPRDYDNVLSWLRLGKPDAEVFVRGFAGKAEIKGAGYLLASGRHLGAGDGIVGRSVPNVVSYAENRWQRLVGTGYFATDDVDPLALHRFERFEGEPSGVVGITDFSRALDIITRIAAGWEKNFGHVPLIAVAVKHGNACGAAIGTNSHDVVEDVVLGDPLAIFGGFVITNFLIGGSEAEALLRFRCEGKRPIDGIAAPDFAGEAVEILGRKSGRCRLYRNPALRALGLAALDRASRFVKVRGGFIKQSSYADLVIDLLDDTSFEWQCVGPGLLPDQRQDAVLAWAVCLSSNSNTVTLVRRGRLIGNGVGQQDRVACCELAVNRARRAGNIIGGALAWSDSFFPFLDGLNVLFEAGVSTVCASRGSMRDAEVMAYAQGRGPDFNFLTAPDAKIRGFSNHTG